MAAPPPSYNAATNENYPSQQPYPNQAPPPVGYDYGAAYGQPPPQGYAYPAQAAPGYTAPPYQAQEIPPSTGFVKHGDVESNIVDPTSSILSFDDKSVRLGFIRKVFSILALQMLVTTGFIMWFLFHEPTKQFVQSSYPTYIAAYVMFLVLYIVLACCRTPARKYPINMILLALFTLSLSYMAAAISSFYDTKIVLVLFGSTCIISIGITLFACQTKFDFTKLSGVLFVCSIALFCFGLFAGIMVPYGHMQIVRVIYGSLGALLFMAFLAFDVQLVMGGRKHEISPEDHVFASMMLYVDIIYIFLFLLQIFGNN